MNEEQFADLRQHMVMKIASIPGMTGERFGKYNLDAVSDFRQVGRQDVVLEIDVALGY